MAAPDDIRVRGLNTRVEDIIGQGGTVVPVNETRYTPDEVILDPNGPLAVQIPENSDADRSRMAVPLQQALAAGHVESVFDSGNAPLPAQSDAGDEAGDNTRLVGSPAAEFDGDMDRVESPPVHSVTELQRTADPVADVADFDPGKKTDEPAADEPNPGDLPTLDAPVEAEDEANSKPSTKKALDKKDSDK